MNTTSATHAAVSARFDREHAANRVAIGNLLDMAARELDRGHMAGARIMLDDAKPYQAVNARIEACWVVA